MAKLIFALFTTIVLTQISNAQQVDRTVEVEATGEDVVQQVLRKISRSAIFTDDKSFLKRIAYVESKFGEASHTFPGNYFGGIWQLSEAQYLETKASSLSSFHTDIARYITPLINWTSTTWQDLTKPLHSGLAARLYLQAKLGGTISGILGRQADLWSTNYNNNGSWTAQYFIREVEVLEDQPVCGGLFDLAIVMDGSGSIGAADFVLAKTFTANLVGTFSRTTTRIGFLVYSTDSEIIFDLTNTYNTTEMQTAIMGTSYPAQNTYTGTAMVRAIEILRPVGRPGVPKIVAVFTDGQSNGGTSVTVAARQVAQANITSFAVGIGTGVVANELLIIANGDRDHMFFTDSYDELSEFFYRFNQRACEIAREPALDEVILDELVQGEKRYYRYNMIGKFLQIKVHSFQGGIVGYYSYSEPNPSSAYYDGVLREETLVNGVVYISIEGTEQFNHYLLQATSAN